MHPQRLFLLNVASNSGKRYWDCKLPCLSLWTGLWLSGELGRGKSKKACGQTFGAAVPWYLLCIRSWCKLLLVRTLTVDRSDWHRLFGRHVARDLSKQLFSVKYRVSIWVNCSSPCLTWCLLDWSMSCSKECWVICCLGHCQPARSYFSKRQRPAPYWFSYRRSRTFYKIDNEAWAPFLCFLTAKQSKTPLISRQFSQEFTHAREIDWQITILLTDGQQDNIIKRAE